MTRMFPATRQGAVDYLDDARKVLGEDVVAAIIRCEAVPAVEVAKRYGVRIVTVLEIWMAADDR